jgi:hypothetical protein
MACTATGTALVGQHSNLATVQGTAFPGGEMVTDTDPSHYFGAMARLALTKLTNGEDADAPPGPTVLAGLPVTWTYHVTNTGNVPIADVTVTDDQDVQVTCPATVLLAGQAMSCRAVGIAEVGEYSNLGSVVGIPPVGSPVSASDSSHYLGIAAAPAIVLAKHTNGEDADDPPGPYVSVGQAITWTYTVTNTGNVTLEEVTVSDDQGVVVSCPDTRLAPGASMVCQTTGTATLGQYTNLGTVTASPLGGLDPVSAEDRSHYFGGEPSIDLDAFTNGVDADEPPGPPVDVGEPVEWTYVVTNTGNVVLSDVLLVDDSGTPAFPGDDYICPIGMLPVRGADDNSCSRTGEAEEGPHSNLATVVGFHGNLSVSDSDPSHYLGVEPWYSVHLPIVLR